MVVVTSAEVDRACMTSSKKRVLDNSLCCFFLRLRLHGDPLFPAARDSSVKVERTGDRGPSSRASRCTDDLVGFRRSTAVPPTPKQHDWAQLCNLPLALAILELEMLFCFCDASFRSLGEKAFESLGPLLVSSRCKICRPRTDLDFNLFHRHDGGLIPKAEVGSDIGQSGAM